MEVYRLTKILDMNQLRARASVDSLVHHICEPLVDVELQAAVPGMKVRRQLKFVYV